MYIIILLWLLNSCSFDYSQELILDSHKFHIQHSYSKKLTAKEVKHIKQTVWINSNPNWHYIGSSNINLMYKYQYSDTINDYSIHYLHNHIYAFDDKKIILKMLLYKYNYNFVDYINQAPFKFIITHWLIDCHNYIILPIKIVIYNDYFQIVKKYHITKKWYEIKQGSIADKQFQYICSELPTLSFA